VNQDLTLEIKFDDDGGQWTVGALSRWNGRIELARSATLSPFANSADVRRFILAMFEAWCQPALGETMSESLHDVFIIHTP